MRLHTEFEPNSLEWLVARSGIPTASEFDQLLTPEFEIRKGQMPATYLHRKLAETWLGGPLPGANVLDMEFGKILEEQALPFYELEFGEPIQRVALVTTDDGRVGCSPDGLIGDEGGIEIKCPEAHTHVGYLLKGGVPKDYLTQIHGAMWVTGRPWWKFLSYRRMFPPLVVTVFRDEKIQAAITDAIALFLSKFDVAMQRVVEMNGGRTPERNRFLRKPIQPAEPEPESAGIIP